MSNTNMTSEELNDKTLFELKANVHRHVTELNNVLTDYNNTVMLLGKGKLSSVRWEDISHLLNKIDEAGVNVFESSSNVEEYLSHNFTNNEFNYPEVDYTSDDNYWNNIFTTEIYG